MKYFYICLFSLFLFFSKFSLIAQELEKKIEAFILNNPEVILKSLENFEKKKAEEIEIENKNNIKNLKDNILNSSNGLYSGNPNGEKIIVEFFDYNCSYCKRIHKDLKKLTNKYKNVKVVYKNFPILSENSVYLAKLALLIADFNNDRFQDYHEAILNFKGRLTENDIKKILNDMGLDFEEFHQKTFETRLEKQLQKDVKLAQSLNLRGTPALIIDEEIVFGYIGFDELVQRILD